MFRKINITLLVILTFLSCKKTDGLKRKLKGKYNISSYESYCGSNPLFEISNPGKIEFTNKKTIQGSTNSQNKTYIGYFNYEYNISDVNGVSKTQSEKEIFIYSFAKHNIGDFDTTVVEISYNQYDYDLIIEKNENGEIIAFKYLTTSNNCNSGYIKHIVKQ